MKGPRQDLKLPSNKDIRSAPVGRVTNTTQRTPIPLSDLAIRAILKELPSRTPIHVTWRNGPDGPSTSWYGYVYESERRRHNGRRQYVFPVEYYFRDEDGDMATLSTYLLTILLW